MKDVRGPGVAQRVGDLTDRGAQPQGLAHRGQHAVRVLRGGSISTQPSYTVWIGTPDSLCVTESTPEPSRGTQCLIDGTQYRSVGQVVSEH
ncbi:hypothetical protein GCM10022420_096890 [Streptomyces iranensis]